MTLPEDFIQATRTLMGEGLFNTLVRGLHDEPAVSIRLNPLKINKDVQASFHEEAVPWCQYGYYLKARPNFTFDPLLHAGAYYVQEASSMFLEAVLKQYVQQPVCMLDLCAAPGGKSTLARTALPVGSCLVSNEPVRNRAQILSENIQKWGYANHITTNNYAKDFRKAKATFDVILADVPCSGEGMFRKDEGAIREWSVQNVAHCQQLQRDIISDVWDCLRPGGLLIYSTCTFNSKENEENVKWIQEEFGAELLPVKTEEAWGITGSLLQGFEQPVYRFLPGKTRGEGLFMAVLQKQGNAERVSVGKLTAAVKKLNILPSDFLDGISANGQSPHIELAYEQAIAYLRREAIVLPTDTPRGIVVVTYQGLPLGLAKNIGNRANNLYPKEWRIKSTHIPENRPTIFEL